MIETICIYQITFFENMAGQLKKIVLKKVNFEHFLLIEISGFEIIEIKNSK